MLPRGSRAVAGERTAMCYHAQVSGPARRDPMSAKPEVKGFFDEPTNTVSYLVWDAASKEAAVIDPVLDFDQTSGEANVEAADALLKAAGGLGLKIMRVLETHAHADH